MHSWPLHLCQEWRDWLNYHCCICWWINNCHKDPGENEMDNGQSSDTFQDERSWKIHYCLGINIEFDEKRKCLWMHQKQYVHSLLEWHGLSPAKSSTTPADINIKLVKDDGVSKMVDPICYQSIVGSLLHAAIATRPDIAQAVGVVSKFNSCPTEAHLTAVKRYLCYIKGTINLGSRY